MLGQECRAVLNKKLLMSIPLLFVICVLSYYYYVTNLPQAIKSNSYIMDIPTFPADTAPKSLEGKSEVVFGWFPWTHGICTDEHGELLRFHISITSDWAYYNFLVQGTNYTAGFDIESFSYENGVLTFVSASTKMIIDYHVPHNVTILSTTDPATYINFIAIYRGSPLWYSKSLDPSDMLPVPETNGRLGGYDGPIRIEGRFADKGRLLHFYGYGDWEHVWFVGGGWAAPLRLWMIINNDKYYGAVAQVKYSNGSTAFHIGRLGEIGGSAYVFDDFEWIDDGSTLPLSVHLKGPLRDVKGNIVGNVDIKADPHYSSAISTIWVLYTKISGTVRDSSFENGTAWAEIRKQ